MLLESQDVLTCIPKPNLSNADHLLQDSISFRISIVGWSSIKLTQAASIHQSSGPKKIVTLSLIIY
jgi:hypothetical protein